MRGNYAVKYCIWLVVGLMLSVQLVHSQSKIDSSNAGNLKNLVKFTVSDYIGLEWEKRISKASVINIFAGMLIGFKSDDFTDYKAGLGITPDAYAEYRNYYNFSRRLKKQRKTRNNSANFLFGRIEVILPIHNQNYTNLLFVQGWGAQRSVSKKFNIGFQIGLIEHFYYDKPPNGGFNYLKFEPLLQVSFSYVF